MYNSGVKDHETRTIGRDPGCHVRLEHGSVSRTHATACLTPEGYLAVQDADSSNGTFLHRNGSWIRVRKVILGGIRHGNTPVRNRDFNASDHTVKPQAAT